MTDHELIQLVQQKAPQELTSEELDLVRARMHHSAALCEALQDQVAFEQFLGERLGQVQVSVEGIYAQAGQRLPRGGRSAGLLGWIFGIGLCVVGVGALVWIGQRPEEIAERADYTGAGPAPNDPAKGDTSGERNGPRETAATKSDVAADDGNPGLKPVTPRDSDPEVDIAVENTSPTKTSVVRPRVEWPELESNPAAARPATEVAFDDFAVDARGLNQNELLRWLAPVPGHNHRVFEAQRANLRVAGFEGLLRWKAPWPADAVVRFSLFEFDGFAMYLWNGNEGVALHYYQHPRPCWAAYEISRSEGEPRPLAFRLVATDNDRYDRTGQGPVELRQQGGDLVLSRGDIRLLTAPLAAPPREVYFDHKATLRSITMYRGSAFPDEAPASAENILATSVPAELAWNSKVPAGTALIPSGIGHVRLSATADSTIARSSVPLPRAGLFEVLAEIEDPTPGSGIYLGDDQGRPLYAVGYLRDQRTGQTVLSNLKPDTSRFEETFNHSLQRVPYAPRTHWVKLIAGSGTVKCWISPDGRYWSRALDPQRSLRGAYSQIGLISFKTGQPRAITLRSLQVRELTGLSELTTPELAARVPSEVLQQDRSYPKWLSRVVESQPQEVAPEDWIRACAVRTLAAVPASPVGNLLLQGLLDYNLRRSASAERRLTTLAQAALLFDSWEPAECFRLTKYFDKLATRLHREGERRLFSTTMERLATAPIWTTANFQTMPETQVRWELLELVYRDLWQETAAFCRRIRFWNRSSLPENRWREPKMKGLVEWAEATALRAMPATADGVVGAASVSLPGSWRHPLAVELSKEGYNTLAELEAALSEQSYRDACQIIQSIRPDGALALLPDGRDPHLLLALPQAVDAAVREHPRLRQTMIDEFGKLGALRLRQAAAESNIAGMQAVAIQFPGTEAAADAHQWLGDRALAAGEFAHALAEFESGLRSAGDWQSPQLAARMRLAGAMLGRDIGPPVTESILFQNERFLGSEFEQLVAEMRRKAGEGGTADLTIDPVKQLHSAPVSRYIAEHRGAWKGNLGRDPEHNQPADIDWVARQLAIAITDNTLYVSNRFQVAAFDLLKGELRWTHDVGNDQGKVHSWLYTPMRPVPAGDRVFVRLLNKHGPELVCLSAADGKVLWSAARALTPVSDPLIIQDDLHVFNATAANQDGMLVVELVSVNPQTGEIQTRSPLTQLRNAWDKQVPCEAAVVGGRLVANLGGSVLCCDPTGRVLWIRRQTWLPNSAEPAANDMERIAPIADGNRVFISQANVSAIECLDAHTGRRLWICPQPGLRSVLGVLPDRLVVATKHDIQSLSKETGEVEWLTPAAGLLDAHVCPAGGPLLVVRREQIEPEKQRPVMAWLDLHSGRSLGEFALDEFQEKTPQLGPMFVHNDRLWVFSGKGTRDATREIYTLTPTGESPGTTVQQLTSVDEWVPPAGDERAVLSAGLLLPGWTISGGGGDGHLKLRADVQGERQVFGTRAEADSSVLFLREESLAENGHARLVIKAAQERNTRWAFRVRVGGRILLDQVVEPATTTNGWGEWIVDLSEFAGETVWIAVEQRVIDKPATAYWKRLDVTE